MNKIIKQINSQSTLNFSGNNIDPEKAVEITKTLSTNSILYLNSNNISQDGSY